MVTSYLLIRDLGSDLAVSICTHMVTIRLDRSHSPYPPSSLLYPQICSPVAPSRPNRPLYTEAISLRTTRTYDPASHPDLCAVHEVLHRCSGSRNQVRLLGTVYHQLMAMVSMTQAD